MPFLFACSLAVILKPAWTRTPKVPVWPFKIRHLRIWIRRQGNARDHYCLESKQPISGVARAACRALHAFVHDLIPIWHKWPVRMLRRLYASEPGFIITLTSIFTHTMKHHITGVKTNILEHTQKKTQKCPFADTLIHVNYQNKLECSEMATSTTEKILYFGLKWK